MATAFPSVTPFHLLLIVLIYRTFKMFWRFGFHACSAIDTLLDKPDVTLEEILGEDDLLQECKAHNTKLIEYLRDPNILSKLLNYIIADEQVDDKAKFKLPLPPFHFI